MIVRMLFTLYFIRPHTLLGMSLWNYWYRSDVFKSIFGFIITDSYMLGVPVGESFIVRSYRKKEDILRLKKEAIHFLTTHPKEALTILKEGFVIQQNILSHTFMYEKFSTTKDAMEEYAKIALYTAILPYFWFNETDSLYTEHHSEIQSLCSALRSNTVYPLFYNHILVPYFENKKEINRISDGMCVEYTFSDTEKIHTISRTELIQKVCEIEEIIYTNIFIGSTVSKNTESVQGTARLIADDISEFKKGEILVVASLNNLHIPLCNIAKAVLCEEGGGAAHVSFIKDIHIPVITHLKGITAFIQNGEKVLVEPSKNQVLLTYEKRFS